MPQRRAAPVLALLLLAAPARALEPFVDFEAGVIWAGYADVRVPSAGGTRFSLTDDLDLSPAPYWRARVGATFAERHTIFAFFTPIRLEGRGTLPSEIAFAGETFAAGAPVVARYRFDSPRLTYRYGLVRAETVDVDVGFTAKIREAAIALQGGRYAETTDTGFVPLLSFRVAWRVRPGVALTLDGDGLAAPQGRAVDAAASVEVRLREGVWGRVGYRVVEGGADNDTVYTFALVNHVGAGLRVAF